MVEIAYCIGCQAGMHDLHHKIIEAAPAGVIGGAQCPCKGECVKWAKPEYVPSTLAPLGEIGREESGT